MHSLEFSTWCRVAAVKNRCFCIYRTLILPKRSNVRYWALEGPLSFVFFQRESKGVLGKKQNSPADPNVNTLFRAAGQRAREKVSTRPFLLCEYVLSKALVLSSFSLLDARLLPEVLAFILVFSSRGSENETLRPYRFWQLQIQT